MFRIQKLREEIGITQKQLAELSGLDSRWIRKLESGEIALENVTVFNMMRILKGLADADDKMGVDGAAYQDFECAKQAYLAMKSLLG